jgi:hypothetical protein
VLAFMAMVFRLPESVRGGAVRRSFGGEWNFASERGSIQPRVPFRRGRI